MKKIFFLIAFFAFSFNTYADLNKISVTKNDEQMMCTMEYAPVCGEIETQCLNGICDKVKQTFGNKCSLNSNKLAKFLYEGECLKSEEYKPINLEPSKSCTREYMPVCGQPKMPECPEGMMCIQVMPQPQTYSNKCVMESFGAEFMSEGTCEFENNIDLDVSTDNDFEIEICTMDYNPVCGTDFVTYGNKCMAGDQKIAYNGECLTKNNVYNIANKINNIVSKKDKDQQVKILKTGINNISYLLKKDDLSIKKISTYNFLNYYFKALLNNLKK